MLYKKPSITAPSILAVENNVDNLLLLSYVLEALNFKFYGVIDSTKVLDLAVDKTPDLILLNIIMPNMSGFEVISQLKSNLFTRNIPVIAVTGLTNLEHQAMIKRADFADYICKPFLLEELEDKVAKYLQYLSPCLVQAVA